MGAPSFGGARSCVRVRGLSERGTRTATARARGESSNVVGINYIVKAVANT